MANKRRPKKTKAPYRRYGPGNVVKHTEGHTPGTYDDEDDEDEVEMSKLVQSGSNTSGVSPSAYGYATTMTVRFANADVEDHSAYPAWPVSKFQKIDVLKFAIINEKIKNGLLVEIPHEVEKQPFLVQEDLGMVFPVELFQLILSYVGKKDPKYLRVCKLWYRIYLPMLYEEPTLDTHNFAKFVDAVTGTKNKVGSLVRRMDLSTIIQSGKNSYVSKLLRRCSENLEVFTAPQTSFGYAPLVSLRGCTKMKVLNLGFVSETVNLKELFYSIRNAKDLNTLSFPRSSISCDECENTVWPPNLSCLRLSGGITDNFLSQSVFPPTIKRLEFAHCPILTEQSIYRMLGKYGENVTHLSFQYPLPKLGDSSLDFVFTYCPNLVFLQVTVDYCSRSLFSEELLPTLGRGRQRKLRTLWIESSGALGQNGKIHPDDLTIAIMEDRLPCLKNVSITAKLGWDVESDDVSVLANLLEENGGGLYLNYH